MLDRSFYNADPLTKNVWYAKLTTEKLINLDVIITHKIYQTMLCACGQGESLWEPPAQDLHSKMATVWAAQLFVLASL